MSIEPHALTALELKALRACGALVVRANLDNEGRSNYGAQVRVILRHESQPYTELSFEAPCWMDYYSKDEVRESFRRGHCAVHIDHYPSQDTPVATVLALLKQGDEVSFDWGIGGYNSQAMESLSVTGDTLDLKVRRRFKKDGQERHMYLTFRLDTRISTMPDTRLIRPR